MFTLNCFSSSPLIVMSNAGSVGVLSKVTWNTTGLLWMPSGLLHTIDGMWIGIAL